MKRFVLLRMIFLLLCVICGTTFAYWVKFVELDDCSVIAKVVWNNRIYDDNSEFFYESADLAKGSRSTSNWTEISIYRSLSSENHCDKYTSWEIFLVKLKEKYSVWSFLKSGINFFADDYGSYYLMNDISNETKIYKSWDFISIKKYKVIYANSVGKNLSNVSDEKKNMALVKINSLLEKYSSNGNISDLKAWMVWKLIALKEIIEENYDK